MKYEVNVEQYQSLQGCHTDRGIIPGSVTRQIHILVGPHMMPGKLFATVYPHDGFSIEAVLAQYFKDNQPCRTTVEIKSLPTPIAIELKVIATID